MRQKILKLATAGFAPGYRDVTLVLSSESGQEHSLHLGPAEVQRLIDTLAEAVANGPEGGPPLAWRQYPQPIQWPAVQPYRPE